MQSCIGCKSWEFKNREATENAPFGMKPETEVSVNGVWFTLCQEHNQLIPFLSDHPELCNSYSLRFLKITKKDPLWTVYFWMKNKSINPDKQFTNAHFEYTLVTVKG